MVSIGALAAALLLLACTGSAAVAPGDAELLDLGRGVKSGAEACHPVTCALRPGSCGLMADGCGGIRDCGACDCAVPGACDDDDAGQPELPHQAEEAANTGMAAGAADTWENAPGWAPDSDAPSCSGELLFHEGFEASGHAASGFSCSGNCPEVVPSPARSGRYAHRSTLDAISSPVSYRTESVLQGVPEFEVGQEYWLGFSVYLPPDWSDAYASTYDEGIIVQLHSQAYGDDSWRTLQPLVLSHADGNWVVRNQVYGDSLGRREALESFAVTVPYEKGVWTDWVFHMRFSGGTDGLIQVWKDDVLLVDVQGQTFFSEHTAGPYFKMGLYQWGWDEGRPLATTRRTVYHDDVRVADSSGCYDLVRPR